MLDPWCTITPSQILPTVSVLDAATSARSHACTKWQLTQSMHSKPSRPWRLQMRNGFLRRNQNPSLKCTGSSFPTNPVCQLLLFKKHHLKISGCLFCDLFSLLSSRFSRCCSLPDDCRKPSRGCTHRPCSFARIQNRQPVDVVANAGVLWYASLDLYIFRRRQL